MSSFVIVIIVGTDGCYRTMGERFPVGCEKHPQAWEILRGSMRLQKKLGQLGGLMSPLPRSLLAKNFRCCPFSRKKVISFAWTGGLGRILLKELITSTHSGMSGFVMVITGMSCRKLESSQEKRLTNCNEVRAKGGRRSGLAIVFADDTESVALQVTEHEDSVVRFLLFLRVERVHPNVTYYTHVSVTFRVENIFD
jgi:hypothetical protein